MNAGKTGTQPSRLFPQAIYDISKSSLYRTGYTPRAAGAAALAPLSRVRMEAQAPARREYCRYPFYTSGLIRSPRVQVSFHMSDTKRRWLRKKLKDVRITSEASLACYVRELASSFSVDSDIYDAGLTCCEFDESVATDLGNVVAQLCLHESRIRCLARPWHVHYLVRLICETYDILTSLKEIMRWQTIPKSPTGPPGSPSG